MPEGEGSLFDDLDAALQSGSSEKRVAMLRQVTDLFLNEADHLNENQIGVFDSVLKQLIERIEARTLAEISERLARVANAPIELTSKLARHAEIGVAGPILTNSSRSTENGFAAFLKAAPNCRNQTPSGCFDFGSSARSVKGVSSTGFSVF